MSHTIYDVLTVWWMVVVFDLSIVYLFISIAKNKE